jgi:hypothetical protein
MKGLFRLAAPFVVAIILSSAIRADDKEGEWTVAITVKDDVVTAKVGDKEFTVKGEEAKKIKENGTYVVKGKLSEEAKTIEATEVKKSEK